MSTKSSPADDTRQDETDVATANLQLGGTLQHGATRAERIWLDF